MTSSAVDPESSEPAERLVTTTRRCLTRRGVIWLGQTCNQRCYFCYFRDRIQDAAHPEHDFMPLDKAKAICRVLREVYGDTAVDIQGGEPTIFPEILELVRFCREIGLLPTLITNGLVLDRPGLLERYQEAGIRDFLVSLHGLGEVHDVAVGRKGAFERVICALRRMGELGTPFRLNCTMSKPVIDHVDSLAREAVLLGARAVNYIAFNPFCDQESGLRTRTNVPSHSSVRGPLTRAADLLEESGVEVNIRYLPLCIVEERHRKNVYNFQQLPYDLHEWNYESWLWSMSPPQMMKESALLPAPRLGMGANLICRKQFVRIRDAYARHPALGIAAITCQRALAWVQQRIAGRDRVLRREAMYRVRRGELYVQGGPCAQCAARGICDGFHEDYADFFGWDEARPITDVSIITDPRYYIRHQNKVVDGEDASWAL